MSALRECSRACTVHPYVGTETEAAITDLKARVTAMRELHVVKWGDIELNPIPAEAGTSEPDETQRSIVEQQKRDREYRIRFGASGGPRFVEPKR